MATLARECRQKGFIRPRPYNYMDRFNMGLQNAALPMGGMSYPRNRMQRSRFPHFRIISVHLQMRKQENVS